MAASRGSVERRRSKLRVSNTITLDLMGARWPHTIAAVATGNWDKEMRMVRENGEKTVLWRRHPVDPAAEKMYGFTP